MRVYFREIAWVAVAQVAAFAGGLTTLKAAAVVLGPAEYGRFSVGLAIVGIFQVCLYGAISQTATRFLMFAGIHNLLPDYELILGRLAIGAAAVIGSLGLLAEILGGQSYLPLPAAILCAYAIVSGVQMIAIAACNAARKRELVAIAQAIEALIRPLLILAVPQMMISNAYNVLFAYVLSTFLILSLIAAVFFVTDGLTVRHESKPSQNVESLSGSNLAWSMIAFAAPFVAVGLLGAIGSHGERLLLARWASWSDVGSYALMMQLVMAPNVLFTTVINQFYLPLVFQFDPSGTREILRSFRVYLLVSILGIAAITSVSALLGPLLIPFFSSRDFLGHEHLLWFLGMSAGIFCMSQQLVLPGLRLNRPAIYMPAKLVHSITLLGLSLVLVPWWGVDGMGIASLLSSTAYLCATLLANLWLKRNTNLIKPAEGYL